MSNKAQLQANNTELQEILEIAEGLPQQIDDAADINYSNTDSGLTAQNVQDAIDELNTEKAPAYTYGTEDMTAGTTELETGKLYFMYEA